MLGFIFSSFPGKIAIATLSVVEGVTGLGSTFVGLTWLSAGRFEKGSLVKEFYVGTEFWEGVEAGISIWEVGIYRALESIPSLTGYGFIYSVGIA